MALLTDCSVFFLLLEVASGGWQGETCSEQGRKGVKRHGMGLINK